MVKKYFLLLLLIFFWHKNLSAQNETQKKIDSLNTILKFAKDDTIKIMTMVLLSAQLNNSGDREKAKEVSKTAYQTSEKIQFKRGKAAALAELGFLEWGEGKLQEAMDKFNTCLKLNEDIGDKIGIGNSLRCIGNIHWSKSEFPDAIKTYKHAIEAYKEAGSIRWVASTYNNLGSTFMQMGDYSESLRYLLMGLKLAKEAGAKDITTLFYVNIGDIYLAMKNYPEALKNYQDFSASAKEIGHKQYIVGSYGALGRLYERQGKYNEALANFLVAQKGNIELGNKSLVATTYNEIGKVYLHQSNYSEALKNFQAAADILQEIDFNNQLAFSYINIGDVLSRQAKLEKDLKGRDKKNYEAIQILHKGLSLAKDLGAKENIKNGYAVISEVYMGMGNYEKALEYKDLFIAVNDSILNNETTRKIEQQRIQYEVEKTIDEEKIKNAIATAEEKAEHKRENGILFTGFAILAIISVFIVLFIRQQNLKRRAVDKAEAGHKMAELELQSLRAQLNPHFMFNSLNAIQDLIVNEKNEQSHLYLSRFSKLLRLLLDNADQPFVTVKQELDLLELYLSLENLRIPDLKYSIEKDKELKIAERMIPNMMLQPYIENAIWHGLSHKKGDRKLHIRIHEDGDSTVFEVEDNGIGRKKAGELKQQFRHGHYSKGMQLLSKRFDLLSQEYGTAIQTRITDLQQDGRASGTLIRIDVPLSLSMQAKKIADDTNHIN